MKGSRKARLILMGYSDFSAAVFYDFIGAEISPRKPGTLDKYPNSD